MMDKLKNEKHNLNERRTLQLSYAIPSSKWCSCRTRETSKEWEKQKLGADHGQWLCCRMGDFHYDCSHRFYYAPCCLKKTDDNNISDSFHQEGN